MADGDALFNRRARLTIAVPVATPGDYTHTTANVLTIEGGDGPNPGHRIQFKIKKSTAKEPNISELTVTNLSESTRKSLQTKHIKLALDVGYEQTGLVRLFVGDVRHADPKHEGPDWNTVLKCGDGERSFKFARALESFAANTSAGDVLKYLAKQLGIDAGNAAEQAKKINVRFGSGYVVAGPAQRELDRLLRSINYTWSIQDGVLQVLASGESITGTAIPLISPETGLVGSPEVGTPEKKGGPTPITFKSLIDKPLRPGSRIHLKSAKYDTDLVVKTVNYDGDTAGGPWYADVQAVHA